MLTAFSRPLPFGFVLLLTLLSNCSPTPDPTPPPTGFTLDLATTHRADTLLTNNHLTARDATINDTTIAGRPALAITTTSEFSDVFLDVERLFNDSVRLATARYLTLHLYVPAASWIRAIKINLADREGNLGGIPEVANNFRDRYDRWITTTVDLRDYHDRYQNWVGKADLFTAAPILSINPYCADQETPSTIYLSHISLNAQTKAIPTSSPTAGASPTPSPTAGAAPTSPLSRGEGPGERRQQATSPLAPKHPLPPNHPFTFTFDNDTLLHDLLAYRTFEASNQSFARNVAGNPTRAIRLRGRDHLNNIAFLPLIDKMTGQPVDFRRFERLFFDYYLTPQSAPFDGSTLTLATPGWSTVLTDSTFVTDFTSGRWTRASVALADLDLNRNWGEEDVLAGVAELRLNLNYRPGQKNIEMWIDNFGWE